MTTLQGLPLQNLPELVRDSHLEATFHPNADIPNETTHLRHWGRRRPQKERWARQKMLSRGGFGIVWLEKRESESPATHDFRAVKQLDIAKTRSEQRDCVRELEALAKFSQAKYSEFFVKSYGWFQSPSALFLAMEYCELGDLRDHVEEHGQLSEDQVQDIGWQILQGLRFMHHNNFAHRDLKPANVLIKNKPPYGDWHVKICDLGLSKRIGTNTTTSTVKGTPGFMPPESVPGIGPNPEHIDPFPADMWCLGETISYLLTRKRTFGGDLIRLQQYWKGGPFPKEYLLHVSASESAISFIQGLMARFPAQRLTAELADQHELMKADPFQEAEQEQGEFFDAREGSPQTIDVDPSSGRWTTEASDQHGLSVPSGSWDTTTVEAQLDTISTPSSPGDTKLVSEDSRPASPIQIPDRQGTEASTQDPGKVFSRLEHVHKRPVSAPSECTTWRPYPSGTDFSGGNWCPESGWSPASDRSDSILDDSLRQCARLEEGEEAMDSGRCSPRPATEGSGGHALLEIPAVNGLPSSGQICQDESNKPQEDQPSRRAEVLSPLGVLERDLVLTYHLLSTPPSPRPEGEIDTVEALRAVSYAGMRKLRQQRAAELGGQRRESHQVAPSNHDSEATSDKPQGIPESSSDTERESLDVWDNFDLIFTSPEDVKLSDPRTSWPSTQAVRSSPPIPDDVELRTQDIMVGIHKRGGSSGHDSISTIGDHLHEKFNRKPGFASRVKNVLKM